MESFVQELASFEHIHQWWSPHTFQRLDNQTLKTFVEKIISESFVIQNLLDTGSIDDFESFLAAILENAPKMITIVLACCLDYLFRMDSEEITISHSIVTWYRQEGWNFPEFRHEHQKIDENILTEIATHPLQNA